MAIPMLKFAVLGVAMVAAEPTMAQQINSEWSPMDSSEIAVPSTNAMPKKSRRGPQQPHVAITPYLEVSQTLVGDLGTGGDIVTYSSFVAGVDASIATRRSQGQISLRYERRIAHDSSIKAQNVVSGLARGSVTLTSNLGIDAGGIATRTRADGRAPAFGNFVGNSDDLTQIYSVFGGPTFSAQTGDLAVDAAYRAGYTKVESQSDFDLPDGQRRFDRFDESISHVANASVRAGPGQLPFGWALSGVWKREDSGQLDRQFDARTVRGDVVWPLSPSFALVGGIGYEDIGIVERDALRDAGGSLMFGTDGV